MFTVDSKIAFEGFDLVRIALDVAASERIARTVGANAERCMVAKICQKRCKFSVESFFFSEMIVNWVSQAQVTLNLMRGLERTDCHNDRDWLTRKGRRGRL